MVGQVVLSGPLSAGLHFFTAPIDGSKAYNFVDPQPEGVLFQNYGDEEHEVEIDDMRGKEHLFELDTHAFAALQSTPETRASKADFSNDETVQKTYYPEVEELLLRVLPGAHRIYIFDHTMRRDDPQSYRKPVRRAHVDQTPKSARQRVSAHLPEEASELLKGRVRIINVWKPLNGKIESSPLAVADSTSVSDETLIGVDIRYPDKTGENAGVLYNPDIKWWYWSGMENDERLLLQIYDSQSGSRVPHAAFRDTRAGEAAKPRESIEVRALVFG